jgi:hypothetical protein
MKPLPRAKPGQPGTVSPKAWNLLVDTVEALRAKVSRITPQSSGDIIHRASTTGFTSHLTRRGGGGSGGSAPLKLTIKQGTAADKFQIIPGTVNSQTPTLGGIALDATTKPEITVTADTWVWVKVVGTFGTPDTYVVTIETEATDSVPSGTDISATGFVAFYYIGKILFTDNDPDPDTFEIVNQHGGGNLGVDSWGLYNHFWRA